jgi:SPP1 gp7 family putative phage head morphogenesis protein
MPLNDELADLATRHQVYLNRYSTAVVRKIVALLDRADADLVAQLLKRDPTAVSGNWSTKRLNALLGSVREINRDAFRLVEKRLAGEIKDLAVYEAGFQAKSLQGALPVALDIVTPSVEHIGAAVLARPMQGRLLKEWVGALERASYDRLRGAIRLGFIEGETLAQITKRVTGTKALKYKDGAAIVAKRHTETLVRTAVNHTANYARQELVNSNEDLIKGVQWVSTLDNRTSAICAARDGKVYPVDSGPRPPAHPNCRSATAPVVKSWKELGFNIDDLPPSTRASMNGQVSATETYQTWLKRQPNEFQDDVLGVTKGKLFRDGGLPLEKFVDRAGAELSLDELRIKEMSAFEKAGIAA